MEAIYISPEIIISNPKQPRSIFDAGELASLAVSIKEHGILQPLLVVRNNDDTYTLIAGERRLRAARLAELETVPVVVESNVSEQNMLELALIENVQRADLNPLEKARAYQQLIDVHHLTHDEVAERVGQHRSSVSNTLRLLKLPQNIQSALLSGSVSERSAIALLALYDLPEPLRRKAGQNALAQDLRPSTIEGKVLGGASSDVVRDLIARLTNSFSRSIIWPVDTAFAVPAEAASLCEDCPSYIRRGGDHLCGDEDCFHVRLNAYNRQKLPLPEPPAPKAPPAMPAPAPVAHRPAPSPAPQEPEETPEPEESPSMAYTSVSVTDTPPEPELSTDLETDGTENEEAPAGPHPAQVAAQIAALEAEPVPAAPTWAQATILLTLQFGPQDGHPNGRMVNIGLRANNNMPAFKLDRELNILMPGYLSELLLDLEKKFNGG